MVNKSATDINQNEIRRVVDILERELYCGYTDMLRVRDLIRELNKMTLDKEYGET